MLYDATVILLCLAAAVWLAVRDSRWLLPLVLSVWAVTPEVRRLIDYQLGSYRAVTPLSALPLAASLTLLIPAWMSGRSLPVAVRNGLACIGAAIAYATGVGAATSMFAAAFEAAQLCAPIAVVPYAATRPFRKAERDLWFASVTMIGAIVSIYCWYQFETAPPWDMLWLVESGMFGSMGMPIAGEFRPFSTLNSAGPFAIFLVGALAPSLGAREWRRPLGFVATALILSCLVLARVRAAWIMAFVATLAYVAVARGQRRTTTIILILFVGGVVALAMPYLPGADKIADRFDTLSNLSEDHSVSTRWTSSVSAIDEILSNPFGRGMGGTGVGAKLAANANVSGGFDNGYIDLLLNFGPMMALLFLGGVLSIATTAFTWRRHPDPSVARFAWLAIAMFAAYAVGLGAYNVLGLVMGMMFWTAIACGLHPADERLPVSATGRRRRTRLPRAVRETRREPVTQQPPEQLHPPEQPSGVA